jgi:hypothetical protein
MTGVSFPIETAKASRPSEGIIPNPKLKLLDQLSEVARFKHYSTRENMNPDMGVGQASNVEG